MASRPILPQVWEVPQVFRDRLGTRPGRQRMMSHEGHLLLVVHKPPHPDDDQRAALFFWRQPEGTWLASESGSGMAALDSHLSEYEQVIDHWETLESKAKVAESYFQVLDNLAPLHRAVRNLHSVLQEARQQIPEDRDLINIRDRAYDLTRRSELLYNAAKNGLDYAMARRAEEQAESANSMARAAHRLNLLAAFFFPLATLSALFGMNLKFGLEDSPPPGWFLTVLFIGALAGGGLTWLIQSKPSGGSSGS